MSNQPSGTPPLGSPSPAPPPSLRPPASSPPPPPLPPPPAAAEGPVGFAPPPALPYPPGYAPVAQRRPPGDAPARPPRPATIVAGWLMLAGGVAIAVGCFLPWASFGGVTINGFDEVLFYESDTGTGVAFMLFAVVMAAFGITTLAARRSLPIMIIGIVIAAFSVLGAVAEYSEYNDMFVDNDRIGGHLGGGLPVVGIGSAVALGGAIAGCSKRRRWPAT